MKFEICVLSILSFCSGAEAFSSRTRLTRAPTSFRRRGVTSLASTPDDEVAALRAAAAKAREEADRLSQELGKTTTTAAVDNTPKKSAEEVKELIPALIKSDVSEQTEKWNELRESGSVSAFGSANLRTFPVSLQMLEQRTGLTPASLDMDGSEADLDEFKYGFLGVTGVASVLAVASLAFLPPNVGATFCYIFASIPILFLAVGSTAPGIISNAIASLKGGGQGSDSGVTEKERICRHEAAHFCCGYWCGLPIAGYSVEEGIARVEFGVRSQEYSSTEVAALAVTALAGLVGEALAWEKAVGAADDLLSLEQVFRKSADFMGSVAQQDVTRWGALTAANLLRGNADKYEQVVKAFSTQAPLEDAVSILET